MSPMEALFIACIICRERSFCIFGKYEYGNFYFYPFGMYSRMYIILLVYFAFFIVKLVIIYIALIVIIISRFVIFPLTSSGTQVLTPASIIWDHSLWSEGPYVMLGVTFLLVTCKANTLPVVLLH